MGFMGMGMQEIIVIVVAALIIFGPNRLPEIAGQAGRAMRDLRKMTQDLSGEFERETGVNVRDLKKTVDQEIENVKAEVTGVQSTISKEVNSAKTSVSSTANKATKSVNQSVSGKSGTKVSSAGKSTSTASKSKTGATISTAKSATAKEKAPPPPKASKRDPLADVSFFEAAEVVPARASASANGSNSVSSASKPANGTGKVDSNGAAAPAMDAVSRARSRRLGATQGLR